MIRGRRTLDRGRGQRFGDDAGQGTIFVIGLVALTFLLTAFFVDVSRSLHAHGQSLEVAAQAARAAADELSQDSLRTADPQSLYLDPAAAMAAGQAWIVESGATGTVLVADDLGSVTVTARVPCPATLTAAFGFDDLSASASASATLVVGAADGPAHPISTAAPEER